MVVVRLYFLYICVLILYHTNRKITDHCQSSINVAETHKSKNHTHILLAVSIYDQTKLLKVKILRFENY